jgi:hypothetical protein
MVNEHQMARKAALINTTNTPGWHVAMQIAEDLVRAIEKKALDCEDETKVISLQRQAKASRQFASEFFHTIEATKQIEGSEDEDDFVEVMTG